VRCFLEGSGIAAFHETKPSNGGVDEIEAAGLAERVTVFLAGRA